MFTTLQRQYFSTSRCSRHCIDSPRHYNDSTSQPAGTRDIAARVLLNPRVFTPLSGSPRHRSDSALVLACVRDNVATVLFNPHVFMPLQPQSAALQRECLSTRACSRHCRSGISQHASIRPLQPHSPRHCSDSNSQQAGAHDAAANALLSQLVFTPLQRQSTTPPRLNYYLRRCS